MNYPEIKKFSLYEDDGTSIATILNEVMAKGNRSTTQEFDNKVIKHFRTQKTTKTVQMSIKFNVSKDVINRIINNYISDSNINFLRPLRRLS